MSPENREHNLRAEWGLADEARAAGDALLTGGHYRSAVNRFYYACFHAARAALLACGDEPKTHSGVRAQFNRRFVQTGKFEPLTAAALASLQQEREDADYSPALEFTAADAQQAQTVAGLFVDAVHDRLQTLGLVDWEAESP